MPRLAHCTWAGANPKARDEKFVCAMTAVSTLQLNPRLGEQLEVFEPCEERRILVGHYELRYAIQEARLYALRLWHTREVR